MIVPLRPCQPIVFVSDRARANKEIEHDGIRGEKRKPKVTMALPEQRYSDNNTIYAPCGTLAQMSFLDIRNPVRVR